MSTTKIQLISADVEMCASQAIREDFFLSPSPSPPPKPKPDSPTTMQSRSIWSDKTNQFIGCQSLYGSGCTHGGYTLPSSPPNETISDQHQAAQALTETTVSAGHIWPSMSQVDAAHSYGVCREDGTFSRLIRADELPLAVRNELSIPKRQGPEGLILVPQPHQPVVPTYQIPIVSYAVRSSYTYDTISDPGIARSTSPTCQFWSSFSVRPTCWLQRWGKCCIYSSHAIADIDSQLLDQRSSPPTCPLHLAPGLVNFQPGIRSRCRLHDVTRSIAINGSTKASAPSHKSAAVTCIRCQQTR